MNFASDNTTGMHPEILAAIAAANEGNLPSYGRDPLTAAAVARVREVFEAPEAEVAFLGTGTGSNALALSQICPPYGRIFCHRTAHIEASECGAPGFFTGGAQMALIDGEGGVGDGRITPAALAARLAAYPAGDPHDGWNAALSLTNATEWGTVYDASAVRDLAAVAREAGMGVHLDGARLGNALVATGARPAEMTHRAGVDVLSLGATKLGCLALEAVVVFDPARAAGLAHRRMRAGQLWSKHRFLAAQMLAWLEGGLWLRLAAAANDRAADLAVQLAGLGVEIVQPVEVNMIFARLPVRQIAALRAAGLRAADWPAPGDDAGRATIRLVTSWATTEAEVDALGAAIAATRGAD